MIEVLRDLVSKASNHVEQSTLINVFMQCINLPIFRYACYTASGASEFRKRGRIFSGATDAGCDAAEPPA